MASQGSANPTALQDRADRAIRGKLVPMPVDGEAKLAILRIRICQHSIRNLDLTQVVPIAENIADQGANLDLEPFVAFDERVVKIECDCLLIELDSLRSADGRRYESLDQVGIELGTRTCAVVRPRPLHRSIERRYGLQEVIAS